MNSPHRHEINASSPSLPFRMEERAGGEEVQSNLRKPNTQFIAVQNDGQATHDRKINSPASELDQQLFESGKILALAGRVLVLHTF
jgi:hypothetical protein